MLKIKIDILNTLRSIEYIHWYALCMTYDNLIIWVRASETSVVIP